MAGFIERNKKKGLLALLLYIARRGKTAAGAAMTLVVVGLVLFLGTPEAVRQRVPWAPRGLLTRGMDTSNSGLGADEQDVAMRLSEEKGEGMESLTRRMLNALSGPKQPVVDMVAAKSADLQEPSAQKQLGDKLSKHGKGIRGIMRKEDSSRGSASIALSPQELQRGLANGPDQITQPQSSMRRNTPGGAPIGGDSSSDFSGDSQIGRQAEAGTPSAAGSIPEVGGPPPDTTSLIIGGGEPIPEARAGDANFDLMAGTYGGGSSGGKADMEGDPCAGSRRAQGCVQWKTEKDKSKKEEVNPALLGYSNDSSPASYQLAEVKAYSFAAAPRDVISETLVTKKGSQPTTKTSYGQCGDNCPKEYASMVSDAPFQRRKTEQGLVKLDDEAVDIGGIPDSAKVADYAQQVKDMDAAAKACEEAALKEGQGYNIQSKKGMGEEESQKNEQANLFNKFMKASDDYLKAIKERGGPYGNPGRSFAEGSVYEHGNAQSSPDDPPSPNLSLFMECGAADQAGWGRKGKAVDDELKNAIDDCNGFGHYHPCFSPKCKPPFFSNCYCGGGDGQSRRDRITKANDRKKTFSEDFKLCDDNAKTVAKACNDVKKAVSKKRNSDRQTTSTEYTISDVESGMANRDCDKLVWNRVSEGGTTDIGLLVNTADNMGRDKNFSVDNKDAEGKWKQYKEVGWK